MRRLLKTRFSQEHGISTVIVAVSLIGLFGAVLLSLDAGNMWQTRRNIITATDATALDRARSEILSSGTACSTSTTPTWTDYLIRNAGPIVTGSEQCNVYPGTVTGTGYVTVQAAKNAKTRFGGLFGIGDTQPYSLSAAQIFYPKTVEGLRPIGLCIGDHHIRDEWIPYQNYLYNHSSPTPSSLRSPEMTPTAYNNLKNNPADEHPNASYSDAVDVVHHFVWDKDSSEQNGCGTDPGNWGWQDFDGGGNPSGCSDPSGLCYQLVYGYQGQVGINDCNADGTTGDNCPEDPGSNGGKDGACSGSAVNNVTEAMRCLIGKTFPIVVYDQASCPGGGNTCSDRVVGFLSVVLWGFDDRQGASPRYLDLEFKNYVVEGICCSTAPNPLGSKAVRLCGVDHDIQSGVTLAQRCGAA